MSLTDADAAVIAAAAAALAAGWSAYTNQVFQRSQSALQSMIENRKWLFERRADMGLEVMKSVNEVLRRVSDFVDASDWTGLRSYVGVAEKDILNSDTLQGQMGVFGGGHVSGSCQRFVVQFRRIRDAVNLALAAEEEGRDIYGSRLVKDLLAGDVASEVSALGLAIRNMLMDVPLSYRVSRGIFRR